MRKVLLSILLGGLLLVSGCKKDEATIVQSISFSNVPNTAGLNQPIKLSIKTYPEHANVPYTLEWTVDEKLASFDEVTQILTRKAAGPVTVKVNIKGRPEVNASVIINPIVAQSLIFKNKVIDAEVGQTVKTEIEVTPLGADNEQFEWNYNKDNLSINESTGDVTVKKQGLSKIYVSVKNNSKIIDSCVIKQANLVYIPDNLFNKYLVNKFDINNNGEIDKFETDEITSIELYNKNIRSLQGIEKFPNLKKIHIYESNIKNIDLNNNLKLTYLYLENNEITSLDLRNNVNLDTLHFENNMIETIDLSRNTKLKSINCYYCPKLKLLNIENITDLEYLNIGYTSISKLNFSNPSSILYLNLESPSLSDINLDQFTNLESLKVLRRYSIDISKNLNLKYLECSDGYLTSLDVSKNTKLECLDLHRNKITSINITNLVNLGFLSIGSNELTSLDLSKNTKLHFGSFEGNKSLTKIYVWKGFTPPVLFTKDAIANYVEVP